MRLGLTSWVALLCLASTSACWDDPEPGDAPSAGSGGASGRAGQSGAGRGGAGGSTQGGGSGASAAGSGGASGSDAGSGGHAGSDAGASGSSGAAGDPGASGSAGNGAAGSAAGSGGAGGGGGAGTALCQPGLVALRGNVGGESVDGVYSDFGAAFPYDSHDVLLNFGTDGRVHLTPSGPAAEGTPTPASALIQLGAAEPAVRAFVCGGAGTSVTLSEGSPGWQARLSSLSVLGLCPGGTPVAGHVTIALGEGEEHVMTSTIEGASFTASLGEGQVAGSLDDPRRVADLFTEARLGVASFSFLAKAPVDLIEGGYLVIPEGYPDAGAVYCIGEGSAVAISNPGPFTDIKAVALDNLSRLGACPAAPIDGEIELCAAGGG